MRILRLVILLLGFDQDFLARAAGQAGEPTTPPAPKAPAGAMASVDLRPEFERWGLVRRQQGARPTCSAFTVAGAMEFAAAKKDQHGLRLSVEFLNWASNKACGDNEDGGFFSDLWKGFATYGICGETDMPYAARFDTNQQPSTTAVANAKARLGLGLRLHWIKEWNVNTGLTTDQLAEIKRTLEKGWPVCGGFRWPKQERWSNEVLQMCPAEAVRDGHSVLLVGFRDDASQPGGGLFLFRNTSNGGNDGMMPYRYAQTYMNDAVWIDY